MDWTAQVDNYCERVDLTFWSEPVNAVTNAAFLIAALYVLARLQGRDLGAQILVVVLMAIGVGSFLFHTFATRWAGAADVAPILIFILVYIFLATRRFFDQPAWAGAGMVALFFPFNWAVITLMLPVTGPMNGSIGYAAVPILIAVYAFALRDRHPRTARGLAVGVAILVASLAFRTVDEAVCAALPLGTHFLWHILNGVMLGWMIWVLHRHRLAGEAAGGYIPRD